MSDWRRYDLVAGVYARVVAPNTAQVARDLYALAEAPEGARVLDVGTGTGVGVEAAAGAGIAVGVDRSPAMLAAAPRPGLLLAAAEAIQLPFRDATFDVVLAQFVIAEFTRYETALFDLIRVLRPGGRLAASAWLNGEDELEQTWRLLIDESIGPELVRSARRDATPWAERFGDPVTFKDTLHEAGLRQIRVERRSYRFVMTRDDYVAEQGTRELGRFTGDMLGEAGWHSFLERARRAFAGRFGEQIEDTREALLAVGTKP